MESGQERIKTMEKKYPDEWLLVKVTKEDKIGKLIRNML